MVNNIFVNLPVKDLKRSMEFFEKLGFTFNKQFTDDNAACLVISENIFAMLLVEKFFKSFIKKNIADSSSQTEAIVALSTESREEVDSIVDKAVAAGGTEYKNEITEASMYGRNFQDPDGHHWEIFYMDMNAVNLG